VPATQLGLVALWAALLLGPEVLTHGDRLVGCATWWNAADAARMGLTAATGLLVRWLLAAVPPRGREPGTAVVGRGEMLSA
jgi:hypothetical protein